MSDALASYTWPTATNPGPELHVERTGDVDADGVADAALTPVETEGWAVVSGAARGAFILPQVGTVARVVGWAIGDETHAQHAQFADLDSDGDIDFIGLRRDGVVALDGPLSGTLDVASARLLVAADLSDAARGGGVSGLVVADYSGDGALEIGLLWGALADGRSVPTAWIMDGPFTSARSLADATRFSIRAPALDSLGDVCSDILPQPIGDSDGDSVYEMILAPNCAPAHVLAADAVGSYEIGVGGDGFLDSSEWLNSLQVLGDLDGDGASDLYVKAHPEEEVGLVFGALPADLTSADALVAQARLVVGGVNPTLEGVAAGAVAGAAGLLFARDSDDDDYAIQLVDAALGGVYDVEALPFLATYPEAEYLIPVFGIGAVATFGPTGSERTILLPNP